jgi:hypothetical protein
MHVKKRVKMLMPIMAWLVEMSLVPGRCVGHHLTLQNQ